MENNMRRVATFRDWPGNSPMCNLKLANNGFFYTGIEDEVQCYSCHVKIRGWKATDSVPGRHKQLSRNCKLVGDPQNSGSISTEGCPEENGSRQGCDDVTQHVALDHTRQTNGNQEALIDSDNGDDLDGNVDTWRVNTETNSRERMIRSNDDILNVMLQSNEDNRNWLNTREITQTYSHTIDYTVEVNRVASFNGHWSDDSPMTVAELASAGLYFTGPGDRVQCAFCRGGLYNWAPGDTAIGEHVRHFPKCNFAQLKLKNLMGKTPENGGSGAVDTESSEHETLSGQKNGKDWINAPSVKIAQGMGYHLSLIKKAAEKVISCSCKRLSSNTLMEAIFELESSGREGEIFATGGDDYDDEDIYSDQGAVGGTNLVPKSIASKRDPKQSSDINSQIIEPKLPPVTTQEQKNTEVKELLEENQRLRGNTTCKVCLDATVDTLFLPCRHLVCCEECASAIKSCPLCRTLILGTVKTFLS